MHLIIKNKFLLAFLAFFLLISGCSYLPDLSKPPIEPNAKKRAQQNVIDGKGIQYLIKMEIVVVIFHLHRLIQCGEQL